MEIRAEHTDEHTVVEGVHRAAFGVRGDAVAALVADLRATDGSLSLVAVDDGQVVGSAVFTRSRLDAPRQLVDVQVLSPLAVLPDRQGEGIGSLLVTAGVRRLGERGAPLVFLEGDPAYYARFGFRAAGELGFLRPSVRVPEVAFQVVTLPAWEEWMTGSLVYEQVFWDHDMVGLRD